MFTFNSLDCSCKVQNSTFKYINMKWVLSTESTNENILKFHFRKEFAPDVNYNAVICEKTFHFDFKTGYSLQSAKQESYIKYFLKKKVETWIFQINTGVTNSDALLLESFWIQCAFLRWEGSSESHLVFTRKLFLVDFV